MTFNWKIGMNQTVLNLSSHSRFLFSTQICHFCIIFTSGGGVFKMFQQKTMFSSVGPELTAPIITGLEF